MWVCHIFSSKEQASFNFMAAVTICSDFGAQENKVCHCFHCFPIYLLWSDGTGCHVFWMLSYMPAFSLSSFSFMKRQFSSSSLSAIRVVSSVYLRLLVFILAVLHLAFALSSLMYSAHKLNKQGDNIQHWHTPFPIWICCSMSSSNCVVFWPEYRFLRKPISWSYSHPFKNFPQFVVSHSVKGFSIFNEAEVDVLLEFSFFFYDPADIGNLISGSSIFSKSSFID